MEEPGKPERSRKALEKFNFALHGLGWITGMGYLVLFGVVDHDAAPWLAIPVVIWTALLSLHAVYAFWPDGSVNLFFRKRFGISRKAGPGSSRGTPAD